MKIGDIIKGKPESDKEYYVTNSAMTRGAIVSFSDLYARVRVLAHTGGVIGTHQVRKDLLESLFEVVGHIMPFDSLEVAALLRDGDKKAISDYDLSAGSLRDSNLRGADLSGLNLINVDLRGACLQNACLRNTHLSQTKLEYSNMECADLSGSFLRGVSLRGVNLRKANLSYCVLVNADLREAFLQGANIIGADIDFCCLPLSCGGLEWHIDKHTARQLAYHFCSMRCDEVEYIKLRDIMLPFANQFHRVDECGVLGSVEEVNNESTG